MKLRDLVAQIPFFIWLGLFILAPLGIILVYAFTTRDAAGLSLANFISLKDPIYIGTMLRSMLIASITTLVCLLVGYPVALILGDPMKRQNSIWFLLFIAPMWINFILRTYAWLSLLENTGIINELLASMGLQRVQLLYNQNAVILGMVYNMLPYMIFPIYTTIQKIDKRILEAGRDLGANGFILFLRIILPLSVPGILSGVTMVFVPSITAFAISKLLGGGMVPLIGDVIEQQFRVIGDWNFGSAISTLVMVIVVMCMWLLNKWSREGDGEVSRFI